MNNVRIFESCLVCDMGSDPITGQIDDVTSLEGSGNNLLVGTESGCISLYSVKETVLVDGKCEMETQRWMCNSLDTHRPINHLAVASALDRVFALSNGILYVLTLSTLQVVWTCKVKGISCVAVNTDPENDNPFVIQVALGTRRKSIIVCDIGQDRVESHKQFNLDDVPIVMTFSGNCICYGTWLKYEVMCIDDDIKHDVDPGVSSDNKCIRTVHKGEFVLTWLPGMAVLATATGSSTKAPIVWGDDEALDISVLTPYVLVLRQAHISVYDLVQQCIVQTVAFSGGKVLRNVDGMMYVATRNQLYRFVSMSWEKQVMCLVGEKKIEEAIKVAETALQSGQAREELFETYQRLRQQCVFIELERDNLQDAAALVLDSQIDAREVISLFRGLLPESTGFVRAYPPLHDMTYFDDTTQRDLGLWLLDLLHLVTQTPHANMYRKDLDTALCKLIAMRKIESLEREISDTNINWQYDLDDILQFLHKNHHARAILLDFHGKKSQALGIWQRLEEKEIEDVDYPGLDIFEHKLRGCNSKECLMKYGKYLVNKDEIIGLQVFMTVVDRCEELKVDLQEVMQIFENRPKARLTLLNKVVVELKNEDPELHNSLANLYMDSICEDPQNEDLRANFRKFLMESQFVDIEHILKEAQSSECDLRVERAYIMGKLGDIGGSLGILVNELKDKDAAVQFCRTYVKNKQLTQRQNTWHALLNILIQSNKSNDVPVSKIIELVNDENTEWDLIETFSVLADHWAYERVVPFVKRNVAKLQANCALVKMGEGLCKGSLANLHTEIALQGKRAVFINDETRCAVCNDVFVEPAAQVYNSGAVVHLNCARHKHLCPNTNALTHMKL